MSQNNDDMLEGLFQAARRHPPQIPRELAARVIADARAVQPVRATWRGWLGLLGGLPGATGLITATFVGLWIGFAPPAGVEDMAGLLLGLESDSAAVEDLDMITGFGWDLDEG